MKKFFVLALVFILLFSTANAFTIDTQIAENYQNYSRERSIGIYAGNLHMNEARFVDIDISNLSEHFPWHSECKYYRFIPYYYGPIIEPESPAGSTRLYSQASLKVRCVTPEGTVRIIKCGAGLRYATIRRPNDMQVCYFDGTHIFDYSFTDISGPAGVSPSRNRYRVKEGEPWDVSISFQVRFRSNNPREQHYSDGYWGDPYAAGYDPADPEFTQWFSSQAEVNAFDPELDPDADKPVTVVPDRGHSEKIEPYYIYFSDSDTNFIAQHYLPAVWENFSYLIREENFFQALKLFYESISENVFSLKRCDSGVMVSCSYDFSEQSLIPHRMNCRGMYTNSSYKATLSLPLPSGHSKAVEFLWYTDSQGRLLNLEGASFDC